jgi:glycosyltransferase involved in cell wall biosynthesis
MLFQKPSVRVCAITCDCYPDDPLVRRTAEAAVSAGYDYHVVCSMRVGQSKRELCNGVHVHRIAIPRLDGTPVGRISGMPLGATIVLWSAFVLLAFAKVTRLDAKLKFNIVHAHNLPDFIVFAGTVPKLRGARIILHVQDVSPELTASRATGLMGKLACKLAQVQERMSIRFADHVLTVGWTLEELLFKRGVPKEKMSSILNSADPQVFRPEKRTRLFLGKPTAERPLILLYHGTCAARCGLHTAIEAMARAGSSAPHVHLHLMGPGDALPSLRELARKLGLADRVVFLPTGPVDAVVDFIAHGDVGIIPYPSAGYMDLVLPTKAYEFALMGRPIVASNLPGIRSMFRPSSVLLCEPSNADSFADAIVEVYRSPEKRAELAKNAEQDSMNYRWELMADRYCRLLAKLAASRGAHELMRKHVTGASTADSAAQIEPAALTSHKRGEA